MELAVESTPSPSPDKDTASIDRNQGESATPTLNCTSEESDPVPEDPVDEQTLAWRAKMADHPLVEGAHRWYFKRDENNSIEAVYSTMTAPVVCRADFWTPTNAEKVLPRNTAYTAILCLTVRSDSHLRSLVLTCALDTNSDVFVQSKVFKEIEDCEFTRLALDVGSATPSIEDRTETVLMEAEFTSQEGYYELHYLEYRPVEVPLEPEVRLLPRIMPPRQFMQCWGKVETVDSVKTSVRAKIIALGHSRSGNHVVTVSHNKGWLYVDIWKLDLEVLDQRPFKGVASSSSTSIARHSIPWAAETVPSLSVSLSFNASKVSLHTVDAEKGMLEFLALEMPTFVPADEKKVDPEGPRSLERIAGTENLELSKGFVGHGRFHLVDEDRSEDSQEYFLASDGATLLVFKIDGPWTQLYSIVLGLEPRPTDALIMLKAVQGETFAWWGTPGVISLLDLKTGVQLSHIPVDASRMTSFVSISKDQKYVAAVAKDRVTIYYTDPGIEFKVYEDTGVGIQAVYFVRNSTQILIQSYTSAEGVAVRFGKLLALPSMDLVDIFYAPHTDGLDSFNIVETEWERITFLSVNYSRLDVLTLEDISVWPTERKAVCNASCQEKQQIHEAKEFSDAVVQSTEGHRYRISDPRTKDRQVEVLVELENADKKWQKAFFLSAMSNAKFDWRGGTSNYHFIPQTSRLVVWCCIWVQIWSLPRTVEEAPELLVCWAFEEYWGFLIRELRICPHGELVTLEMNKNWYDDQPELSDFHFSVKNLYHESTKDHVLQGMQKLPFFYLGAEEREKKAILRYTASLVNDRLVSADGKATSLLAIVCAAWTLDARQPIKNFLREIALIDPTARWTPLTTYTEDNNPLAILLKKAEEEPKVVGSVKILVQYALQRTREENNVAFIKFVLECMDGLLQHCPDVAMQVLRGVVYTPSSLRTVVVKNHALAAEPSIRNLWRSETPPLNECRKPILQLQVIPPKEPDPRQYYFTQDLYEATFEMLWTRNYRRDKEGGIVVPKREDPALRTNWFKSAWHLFLLTCNPQSHRHITLHEFELEHLENPAIEALIQYKWNTFGYTTWLLRFIVQCTFYTLIVIAMTMQVYFSQPEKLVGVFIAIIAMAATFIWLEYPQFREHPSRYFTSPYNYLDLITFILPAAASIVQLVDIQNGGGENKQATRCLSFSILFIFIHLLFELRINKSVCKYVTIVLQVMGEIKAFFIVFAISILAFALAILHMLRGRSVGGVDLVDADTGLEAAPEKEIDFPLNFLKAISATYFMAGGRYDSLGDLFEGDDAAFHIMMMFYFFFTVILMLNVLIALINIAFNKGDESWRLVWLQNRLRYAESAENMSYHIPGFRQTHNYFPEKIYYTATHLEAREYRRKNAQLEEDSKADRKYKTKTSESNLAIVKAELKIAPSTTGASATTAATTSADTTSAAVKVLKTEEPEKTFAPSIAASENYAEDAAVSLPHEQESTAGSGGSGGLVTQETFEKRNQELQRQVQQLQESVKESDRRAQETQQEIKEMLLLLKTLRST